MRATLHAVARQLPGGCGMLLVLALVACQTSPAEQLTRAETMLGRLESKGADQYLIYQMAEIRRGIEIARKDIRNNRLEMAYRSLHGICERLDSCGTAFLSLRKKAAQESQLQIQGLAQKLQALDQAIAQLPRLTYVDQNRHDIQMHRLRRYHQELDEMADLIQNQDFQKALNKGDTLVQQVDFMLGGLKAVPALASRGKTPAPQTQLTPRQERPVAAAASMLAASAH